MTANISHWQRAKSIAFLTGAGILAATQWPAMAVVGRSSPSLLGTLGIQYLLGAISFFVLHSVSTKSVPHLSLRLAQASVAVAVTCFFMPGVLTLWALKNLPSFLAALCFASVPMWLWIFGLRQGRPVVPLLLVVFGIALTIPEIRRASAEPDQLVLAFLGLVCGVFLYAFGFSAVKKLYWIHSSGELTFWGLLFAAALALILNLVLVSDVPYLRPGSEYFYALGYLGVVGTGAAAFLSRYSTQHLSRANVEILTGAFVVGALGLQMLKWPSELQKDFISVIGLGVACLSLIHAARSHRSINWVSFYLVNSLRRRDRVSCALEGTIWMEKKSAGRIRVTDISIYGLGFRSDVAHKVADQVVLAFPIEKSWTQIALDSRVVFHKKLDAPDLPYLGGVEFVNISAETRQHVAEFLAKIGNQSL